MSLSGAVDGDDLPVVAGFAARYSDDQLQAYIAIQGRSAGPRST
jgi:hypothetical protein